MWLPRRDDYDGAVLYPSLLTAQILVMVYQTDSTYTWLGEVHRVELPHFCGGVRVKRTMPAALNTTAGGDRMPAC